MRKPSLDQKLGFPENIKVGSIDVLDSCIGPPRSCIWPKRDCEWLLLFGGIFYIIKILNLTWIDRVGSLRSSPSFESSCPFFWLTTMFFGFVQPPLGPGISLKRVVLICFHWKYHSNVDLRLLGHVLDQKNLWKLTKFHCSDGPLLTRT